MGRPYRAYGAAALWNFIERDQGTKAHKFYSRESGRFYAVVQCNPELRFVSHIWFDRFDNKTEFRRVLSFVYDLFCEGDYGYWLGDLRFLTSSIDGSEDWIREKMFPSMFRAGLEKCALVMPRAAFCEEAERAHAVVSDTLETISDERVRTFDGREEAKIWLLGAEGAARLQELS